MKYLFLTKDTRNKEVTHHYYRVVGFSLFSRLWYIRRIKLWNDQEEKVSSIWALLKVVSQKDNIFYVEVVDGLNN